MFVITANGTVILGPMRWNKTRFQNTILEDCGISTILPNDNDDLTPISINPDIRILPVQTSALQEPFNSKIQELDGPYWQFTETHAISSYRVRELPIDIVKDRLRDRLAQERWKKETSGTTAVIQNIRVTINTDRDSRTAFTQKYLVTRDGDTVAWKFPQGWLKLTKQDLKAIAEAADAHAQQAFDWELSMSSQIDTATTLNKLDDIVIVEKPARPGLRAQ